jgi:hypothetical protein
LRVSINFRENSNQGAVFNYIRQSIKLFIFQSLLFDPLDPDLQRQPQPAKKFKAQRSLRDVEPVVNLWVRNPDGKEIDEKD